MSIFLIILIILGVLFSLILIIKIATKKQNSYSNPSSGGIFNRMKSFGAECCNKIAGKMHGI